MSRLIVKNLPKNITDERVKTIFAEMGQITDLKLKYTTNGVFRRFAFVGYKTHTEAQRALKHFDNTFIDTSKIQVDVCKDLGDDSVPRPWSKYSEKSSAFQRKVEKVERRKRALDVSADDGKSEEVAKKQNKRENAILEGLENDSRFQEFLEVHKLSGKSNIWGNDEHFEVSMKRGRQVDEKEKMQFEDSSCESDKEIIDNEDTGKPSEVDSDEEQPGSKEAANTTLSDMDYLKKKVLSEQDVKHSKTETKGKKKNKSKKGDTDSTKIETKRKQANSDLKYETCTTENNNETEDSELENFERKSEFTVKLRGLPFHAKKKDIEAFLFPLKILDVRLPKDLKNRPSGRAYVDLESKKCVKEALKRHKDYIKGRYIEVFQDRRREVRKDEIENEPPPWIENAKELAENKDLSIAETGRLYLRNLSYACTEEELLELFSKYGPTTEVFVPVDKRSDQSMGFAFITFMMPEHAVQAFNELDGHVFQGRLLHILPAKPKRNADDGGAVQEDETSYKRKKQAITASLKGKEHNWNTLFLGVNAVAEIMADKYKSNKSDVLNVQSKGGLALRMALGETQVVAETKEFLVNHGVKLDAFGQPDAKRSKTVIIVKNLQHGTKLQDLENLFTPFGHLVKVILPPSGVTALVVFEKLSSAAKAFEKIAYTKFDNIPLYLEWAPADVFDTEQPLKENDENNVEEDGENEEQDASETDDEASEGHVIFVKNLNFETNEDSLKQVFGEAGKVRNVTIAKKKDSRNKGAILSMGYGFVEYKAKKSALNAIKKLQGYELDGHNLELKMSNKKQTKEVKRKSSSATKQKSSKILVRNVPFEATQKELRELFGTFGELKTVRLPKKLSGTGPHRGFAFIDFLTKQDAKRAFKSLCTSTHLYGRRLVLEWADDAESIDELRKKTADYFHEPKKKTKAKDLTDKLDG